MLTEAGESFLPFALGALQQLEAGIAATRPLGAFRTTVSIVSYPGASAQLLAPFIKGFHDRHPEARIEFRDLISVDAASAVLNGDADVAIHPERPSRSDKALAVRPLYREPIRCLMPAGHPLADSESITPRQLNGQPIIMTSAFTQPGGRYQSLIGKGQIQVAEETLVGQPTTVAALAAAGIGIGVLPALAAQMTNLGGHARIVPVADPTWQLDIYLLTNRARTAPPAVSAFVRELTSAPLPPPLSPPWSRSARSGAG